MKRRRRTLVHNDKCQPQEIAYERESTDVGCMSSLLRLFRTRVRLSYRAKVIGIVAAFLFLLLAVRPPLVLSVATCTLGITNPKIERKVSLVGHRGTEVGEPENTLEAAKIAASSVAYVELDLTASSDEDVFLMHDDDLERTTNGSGRPCERDNKYLRSLVARSKMGLLTDRRIPMLKEVFAALPSSTRYMLDVKLCNDGKRNLESCVKCETLVRGTANDLKNQGIAMSQITFTSTDNFSLRPFQKHFTSSAFAISMDLNAATDSSGSVMNRLEENSWDGITAYTYLIAVRPDMVRAVHNKVSQRTQKAYSVFGWTVRTSRQLRVLLCGGADHIVTGDPVRFKQEAIDILGPNFVH